MTTLTAGSPVSVPVVVWDCTGQRVLTTVQGPPRLPVEPPRRVQTNPATWVDRARQCWGLDLAFLRRHAGGQLEFECLDDAGPPPGTRWGAPSGPPPGDEHNVWARPGWYRAMLADADAALTTVGIRRTGRPTQVRHWALSAIVRFPTDHGVVWLKAVPPLFAHEQAVIRWVAERRPHAVPTILCGGDSWWLTANFAIDGGPPRSDPLDVITALQLESVGATGHLEALGCPDRRLARMAAALAALARRADLLTDDDRAALRGSLDDVAVVFDAVERLGFPATLVHGDLHWQNVRWTTHGWLLYDWTDSCVTHPFVELTPALEACGEAERKRRSARFAEGWARAVDAGAVQAALDAGPVLGAAHRALTFETIHDGVPTEDAAGCIPVIAHHVRALVTGARAGHRPITSACPSRSTDLAEESIP
jgi:hypothetical protein